MTVWARSVQLTRAGSIFREHARRALREMELAQMAIAEVEGLHRGALAVGVVQTVNAYLIPEIVSRFSNLHPQVGLKLDELSGPDIEAGVRRRNTRRGHWVPAGDLRSSRKPAAVRRRLCPHRLARHRFAKRRRLSLSSLSDESLILLPGIFCTRRLLNASFEQAGIQPKIIVEMNSIEGILATVRTSTLPTILPRLSLGSVATMCSEPLP